MQVEELGARLLERAGTGARLIVSIAGPPAAGKSTLVEALRAALEALGQSAAVVPMDGFHLDDAILEARGDRPRKGAPHTYDVHGLLDCVETIRKARRTVYVPVFDRSMELSRSCAQAVEPGVRFVLVEGNYLALDAGPWTRMSELADIELFLEVEPEVLERRLAERWADLDDADARAKIEENDLPNARLVLERSRRDDIVVSS